MKTNGGSFMLRLSLNEYFDEPDSKYYAPSVLVSILEQFLGKSLSEIKTDVNSALVSVTSDEIKKFLEEKFREEDPELKERIEFLKARVKQSSKPTQVTSDNLFASEEIEDLFQVFADNIKAQRYYLEPYALEYFSRYIAIVRKKALLLLSVIEQIVTGQTIPIQGLLADLDIQLDEHGNITKEDIIRLIAPAIQNIIELNEKVVEANALSTYLTFKLSKEWLYGAGWTEDTIYPTEDIFVRSVKTGYGNVPISSRQKENLCAEFNHDEGIGTRIRI